MSLIWPLNSCFVLIPSCQRHYANVPKIPPRGEHSCAAVSGLGYVYKTLSCPRGGSLTRLGATGAPARAQEALGRAL